MKWFRIVWNRLEPFGRWPRRGRMCRAVAMKKDEEKRRVLDGEHKVHRFVWGASGREELSKVFSSGNFSCEKASSNRKVASRTLINKSNSSGDSEWFCRRIAKLLLTSNLFRTPAKAFGPKATNLKAGTKFAEEKLISQQLFGGSLRQVKIEEK